jgi:hypothetical protein
MAEARDLNLRLHGRDGSRIFQIRSGPRALKGHSAVKADAQAIYRAWSGRHAQLAFWRFAPPDVPKHRTRIREDVDLKLAWTAALTILRLLSFLSCLRSLLSGSGSRRLPGLPLH